MPNAIKTMLAAPFNVKFIKAALLYNVVVFSVFYGVYLSTDFSHHFTSDQPVTVRGKLYYALMMHTAVGINDITPKTEHARMITSLHVMCAWLQLLLVFLTD